MESSTKKYGLWALTAPARPVLPTLEGDQTADVAVIGGGYTGVSAALHLAEAGTDVVLLEAEEIGYGGSGRNVGLVNAGLWMLPDDIVKAAGPDYGERINSVLGRSPELVFGLIKKHGIECEAQPKGTLHCAHSKRGYAYLKSREAQWQRRGAPVKLLGRAEAADKVGSPAFHGALLDLRAGTVQPLAYIYGLSRAALRAGAKLHDQSPVSQLAREGDCWRLTTPRGTLRAKTVIVATNAYLNKIFGNLKDCFIPFNYFQFCTAPLPKRILRSILPEGQGAWDTATVLSSFRLDQTGRLIVGSVGQTEEWAHGLHKNWAHRTIRRVFPQVDKFELEYGWYGVIAMTADHVPRFHLLGPDMFMITSYNGRGIGPGTVCGKLLAGLAMGGSTADMPLPVSEPQSIGLCKLREMFYESGARLYHFIQRRV
jgi:glycine/D-amino acid oxidase-like deaminating enzyme